MNKPTLAIIIPCYNEENVIEITIKSINALLKALITKNKISASSYICCVNDGSNDNTWNIIKNLNKENRNIKGINLSNNVGHQKALISGLYENIADIFISIDADLQDDINIIPEMIDKYLEGNDIVYGIRSERTTDSFFKRFLAENYYKLLNLLKVESLYNHADYRLLSKKIVNHLKNFKEVNIYLRGLIPLVGYNSDKVFYERKKRVAGQAKYNLLKSSSLAIDGITSFSIVPLRFISILGLIICIFSFLMTIYAFQAYITKKTIQGWLSTVVPLYFLGGVQLLSLGIIGEYIGKIYKETKKRPNYFIKEVL